MSDGRRREGERLYLRCPGRPTARPQSQPCLKSRVWVTFPLVKRVKQKTEPQVQPKRDGLFHSKPQLRTDGPCETVRRPGEVTAVW